MHHIAVTKAFGIINLIISLGFLFNLRHYEHMARKMATGPDGFILGGILPVLVSTLLLSYHNIWQLNWDITLTITGWILLIVGIFRIWFVYTWTKLIRRYIRVVPVLFAVFGLIFGLMLCYAGFVAPLYHIA